MRRLLRVTVNILIGLALMLSIVGCRKSAEQIRAEREAKERAKKQRQIMTERARAEARSKYHLGKEKGLQRKYKEAIDLLDEAERLDENIELEVQLFRNRMAEDMLEVADRLMEDGVIDSAERIIDMLDNKARFKKYLDKTREERRRLEWFRKGYKKLALAEEYIAAYKTTEAINILKELVDEYAKTMLADKAAAVLRTLGQ